MFWKQGLSIGAGYLLAKVPWAIVVTLDYGRLPTDSTEPMVHVIFDLGILVSVLGGIVGGVVFDLYTEMARSR